MADKKISQLTGATTPLAGSEVLPIVQGGSTVKVSVNDLTAGKAVTASTLALSGGAAFGGATLDNGVGRLIVDASGFSYAITAIGNDQTSARIRFKNSAVGGSDYAFIAGENNVGQTGATFFKIGTGTLLTLDDGSGNFKVNGGNVVVGTAGKGIADSAGTQQLYVNTTGIGVGMAPTQKFEVAGAGKLGLINRAGSYTGGATTVAVGGVSYLEIANSGATSITAFTGASAGQVLFLKFNDGNTTITRNNAYLAGGANFTSTANATLVLIYDGANWFEVSRSTTNS